MRVKDVILSLVSLALVGAGVVLIAAFFLGPGALDRSSSSEEPEDFDVPVLEDERASEKQQQEEDASTASTDGPEDQMLWLTVPKMAKIWGAPVPSAEGNDEETLKDYAAIHLKGSGFPWEPGANVYIAGHRLGYPESASFLAFYDLDNLVEGDLVSLVDTEGTVYSYQVSRSFYANPTDFSITEPVEGEDVLTLQTCTLPDYSQRLIVQAEKVV